MLFFRNDKVLETNCCQFVIYHVVRATTRPSSGSRNKQINDEEIDSEAAALAGFDFLQNDEDEEENDDDIDDGGSADDESDERDDVREGMRLKKSKPGLYL